MSNNEKSSTQDDREFNKWADHLETLSDEEVSRAIFDRIIEKGDIDEKSKTILTDAYEYSVKLIKQGKQLDTHLLTLYMRDVRGYDVTQIDAVNLFMLLGICGITFTH